MNLNFLIVSYFACIFVDWIFQSQWQALNKSKWGKDDRKICSFVALLTHSITYSTFSVILIYLILGNTFNVLLTTLVLFISHMLIDNRIPVKWIMKFKGMTEDQINDHVNFGSLHIGIDHRLHELTLLILSILV